MQKKLTITLTLAALGCMCLFGADRYFQPQETRPSVTTYALNLSETREAAIMWLHSQKLYPTNGVIEIDVNCGGMLGKDGKPMEGIIIRIKR